MKKPMVNTTPDVDVLYNMLLEAKENGVQVKQKKKRRKRHMFHYWNPKLLNLEIQRCGNEEILRNRISDLERALELEKLRSRAFEKMIQIAEQDPTPLRARPTTHSTSSAVNRNLPKAGCCT